MTADGERVRIGDVELFLRRFGDPAAPLLVCIHGGPTWDHSYLLPAAAELADVAHVLLFDLRGCGRSCRVAPYGDLPVESLQPDLIADDVAGLIDRYGGGRGDVLGFSYGGMVAMRVVDQHPEAVRRLILASTTAYPDFQDDLDTSRDRAERAAMATDIAWDDPRYAGPAAPDGALSRAMAYGSAPLNIWRLDRLAEWHTVLERVRFSNDWTEPFVSGRLRSPRPEDPESALSRWGGPMLILHGEREMSFPVPVARRLHEAVPRSRLVLVPEAAHMAHFDNPDVWVAAARDFLTAGDPTAYFSP